MQTNALNGSRGSGVALATAAGSSSATWAIAIGRIALALLFLWSAYGKLTDIAGTVAYMNAYHMPMAGVLVWPAALVELVGGVMLLAGWKARWAALVLAALTVVSAAIFHNFWAVPADEALNQSIHFMKNVAIAGGLLQVFGFGSGRYALERR